MSTEDDREKSREEVPKWHRARAARLRANGFERLREDGGRARADRGDNRTPGSRRINKDTTRRRGRAGRAAPTPSQRGDDGYAGMPPRSNVDASPEAHALPFGS